MKGKCIMIIDDNPHDIFFTERVIKENNENDIIITKESSRKALDYLKSNRTPKPDIIFLDIHMPVMDGWEFLDQYCLLDEKIKTEIMIVMLATSGNPEHIDRANNWDCISDYITKPLTPARIKEIRGKLISPKVNA